MMSKLLLLVICAAMQLLICDAFLSVLRTAAVVVSSTRLEATANTPRTQKRLQEQQLLGAIRLTAGASSLLSFAALADDGFKGKLEYQPALQGLDYGKPRTFYPDFKQAPSGLQYKIVKEGTGASYAKKGDRVVVDWEGYTIGYYGRPFQTRNKVKGGAFDSTESDNFRWVLGSGNAIAALDEGVQYIKEGGVAQIIVPAELGYPVGDSDHQIVGPRPTTFSGQRALNFVLDNKNLIDKTLLINIRLVRIDKDKGL